jgi:aspartyl protease family protein
MRNLLLLFFLVGLGCSQSGRRSVNLEKIVPLNESTGGTSSPIVDNNEELTNGRKTVVKMKNAGGVNYIPVEVDGVKMLFIFDTGASSISISQVEALYLLKQGHLTEDDILGSANFTDANGDISEGTMINLKTVRIGDRMLTDVEASVVHNLRAPLLFGQSALSRFGKISIDNQKGEITFE